MSKLASRLSPDRLTRWVAGAWPGLALALAVATAPSGAAADEPAALSGSWIAGPMTVRWVIGEWGDACGPRPSGGGAPGGPVEITEQGGELLIRHGDRTFSTASCWELHEGLSPGRHSRATGSWKTTCRTAPNDPRQELLEMTLAASGDELSLSERGQYQFSIEGQTCSASSGRWRTYRRSTDRPEPLESEVSSGKAPVRERASSGRCDRLGAPAKMEIRPSRKLMRPGESFRFGASVRDAKGCALGSRVVWELLPADSGLSLKAGRVAVPAGAADLVATVRATVGESFVEARVEVVSDERYEALLRSGGFNADGASDEAAMTVITSGSVGAVTEAPDEEPDRKWAFVAVVGGTAALLALVGLLLLRRHRAQWAGAVRSKVGGATGTVVFQGEPAGPADGAFAPRAGHDATRLEPLASERAPAPEPSARAVEARRVCPACGTLYEDAALEECPRDGTRLLPVNA